MFQLKDILRDSVQESGSTGLAEDMALLADPVGDAAPVVKPVTGDEPIIEDEPQTDDEPEQELETADDEPEEHIADDKPIYEKPTIAQLKEKYPDILKTFPALRDVYYREKAYSELFPTMEDARAASEDSESFGNIRRGVLEGNLNNFFSAVKEASPESLDKIAGNILPTLNRISPELHEKATIPLLENLVRAVYREGARFGDSEQGNNFRNSALWIAQFLFGEGSNDIVSGKKSLVPIPDAKSPVTEQQKELDRIKGERASEFLTSTEQGIFSSLKDKIMERGFQNKLKIDPDGVMTDFMKTTIADRIMQEVQSTLAKDPAHMRYMKGLWTKANEAGYTSDWKSRITNAYLERAKSLVPAIRNRLVAEALGTGAALNNKKLDASKKLAKRVEPGNGGQAPNGKAKVYNAKQIDYRKTSDMDILNDNVTLRK